jgi:hypothetical protein
MLEAVTPASNARRLSVRHQQEEMPLITASRHYPFTWTPISKYKKDDIFSQSLLFLIIHLLFLDQAGEDEEARGLLRPRPLVCLTQGT